MGSWSLIAVLMSTGALAAASWRVMTAGAGGANIGGGLMFLVIPPAIAALLLVAVSLAVDREPEMAKHRRLLTFAAVLTAPALWAGMVALT